MFFHFLLKQASIDLKTIGGFRLFLQDAEEFGRKVRREFADLVEKNATAFGHFEAAGLASDGSGEGSALVAKTITPPAGPPHGGEKGSENPRLPAVVKQDAEDGAFEFNRPGSKKGAQKPPRSREEVWRGGTSK